MIFAVTEETVPAKIEHKFKILQSIKHHHQLQSLRSHQAIKTNNIQIHQGWQNSVYVKYLHINFYLVRRQSS